MKNNAFSTQNLAPLGSNLVNPTDFKPVAQLTDNVDTQKLSIAVYEAEEFDLKPLTGMSSWGKLKEIIRAVEQEYTRKGLQNPADPRYSAVLGGTYYHQNQTREQPGLKRIIVYYSYSRYLLINEFNDSPNGNVSKNNNFSLPKPLKEIKDFANKYRDMAMDSWKYTLPFLCLNKNFLNLHDLSCADCQDITNSNNSTAKGFGFRTKHIRKY